jgi:hypothetical protein
VSLSFDFTGLFSYAGIVLSELWVLALFPAGVLAGFLVVKRIKRFLTMRAGVEKRRSHYF